MALRIATSSSVSMFSMFPRDGRDRSVRRPRDGRFHATFSPFTVFSSPLVFSLLAIHVSASQDGHASKLFVHRPTFCARQATRSVHYWYQEKFPCTHACFILVPPPSRVATHTGHLRYQPSAPATSRTTIEKKKIRIFLVLVTFSSRTHLLAWLHYPSRARLVRADRCKSLSRWACPEHRSHSGSLLAEPDTTTYARAQLDDKTAMKISRTSLCPAGPFCGPFHDGRLRLGLLQRSSLALHGSLRGSLAH